MKKVLFVILGLALIAPVRAWSVTVDVLERMFVASPGTKQCSDSAGSFCLDMTIDSFGERIYLYANGIRDYTTVKPYDPNTPANNVGSYKNAEEGAINWRCFANQGALCNSPRASFPPHGTPQFMDIPIIACSSIVANRKTPGAMSVPGYNSSFQGFSARGLNPHNCGDLGLQGNNWHKMWVFLAQQCNFGGNLGSVDALIYESESISVQPTSHVGGERLERYYGVWAKGRSREEGFDDPFCRANPNNPGSCNGNYDTPAPGTSIFPWTLAGDMTANSICPY